MPCEGRGAAQEEEGVCGSREWDEDSCKGAARRRTFRKWCCGRVNRGIRAKGREVCRLQQKGRDPSCHGFLAVWPIDPSGLGGNAYSAAREGQGARAELGYRL